MNTQMNIDKILTSFNTATNGFPAHAVESALTQQEQITPRLLDLLEHTLLNYKKVTENQMDYIFAIYLLSKFKEEKAFPLIVRLASLPDKWSTEIFGDCLTEAFPRFFASTFNADLLSLKDLIENTSIAAEARDAGLRALLGLVASNQLERDDLISYFRSLFNSTLIDDPIFTAYLINAATDLYPDELFLEIDLAYENNRVDISVIGIEEVIDVLDVGKEESLENNLYGNVLLSPITNVENDMAWMEVFESTDDTHFAKDHSSVHGDGHHHCQVCEIHKH